MQITFQQKCDSETSTNIEHQPSTDKSTKIDSSIPIPTTTATTILTSSITDLTQSQSPIVVVPTIQSSSSAQSLPSKSCSFEERERKHIDSINKTIQNDDCIEGIDDLHKTSETISVKCENNNNNSNEPNETNVRQENNNSVVVSDINIETCSMQLDCAKVQKESIILSASPPKITVVCAPCIDEIILESVAKQQLQQQQCIEQIECDDNISEDCAQSNDNNEQEQQLVQHSTDDCVHTATTEATTITHQLSLEVRKCDETTISQEDLSPNMDEYQGKINI